MNEPTDDKRAGACRPAVVSRLRTFSRLRPPRSVTPGAAAQNTRSAKGATAPGAGATTANADVNPGCSTFQSPPLVNRCATVSKIGSSVAFSTTGMRMGS